MIATINLIPKLSYAEDKNDRCWHGMAHGVLNQHSVLKADLAYLPVS